MKRAALERAAAASQIKRMNMHRAGRSFICAFALSLPLTQLARADVTLPPTNAAVLSCGKLMDTAMAMLLKMPAGVEKMAAQKELVNAKDDSDRGDMAGCKTHVDNAIGAMTAHNPG
ncbi:MAG TPA: hypothetical protein VIY90_24405 [Steroidobacteraceae bacterium]